MNKLDEYYEKEYSKKVAAKQREEARIKEENLANQKKYIEIIPVLIEKILEFAEVNRPECERLMQRTEHKTPLLKGLFARPGSKYYNNNYYTEYTANYGWKVSDRIYLLTNGRLVHFGIYHSAYDHEWWEDVISRDVDLHSVDAVQLYEDILKLGYSFEDN